MVRLDILVAIQLIRLERMRLATQAVFILPNRKLTMKYQSLRITCGISHRRYLSELGQGSLQLTQNC